MPYGDGDTEREHHETMESDTEVLQLQAKEHLGLLEAGKSQEGSSSKSFGGSMTSPTP